MLSVISLADATANDLLAFGSVAIALLALAVNVTGIIRRPRITSHWQVDAHGEDGVWVMVTARRRAIEVTEIGVMHSKRTWRRQFPSWRLPKGSMVGVPHAIDTRESSLQDGQTILRWLRVDRGIGEGSPHLSGVEYCYAVASGKVYFARSESKVRRWLASLG